MTLNEALDLAQDLDVRADRVIADETKDHAEGRAQAYRHAAELLRDFADPMYYFHERPKKA